MMVEVGVGWWHRVLITVIIIYSHRICSVMLVMVIHLQMWIINLLHHSEVS